MNETWFGVMTTGPVARDVLDALEADAEESAGRRPEPGAARLEEPERDGTHALIVTRRLRP